MDKEELKLAVTMATVPAGLEVNLNGLTYNIT